VRALGMDLGRIWLLVFGLGSALAGLAGILAAPMYGVYAEMGVSMIIQSFVVVVVGGMGSLTGAVVAGLLIGEVVGLTTLFAPQLAEIVWGYEHLGDTRTIDVHIGNLRHRIEAGSAFRYIETVRGLGYRFRVRPRIEGQ